MSPSLPQEGPEKGDRGTGRLEKGRGVKRHRPAGLQGKIVMGRLKEGGIKTQE